MSERVVIGRTADGEFIYKVPTCGDLRHATGAEGEQPYARCPACGNYLALAAKEASD